MNKIQAVQEFKDIILPSVKGIFEQSGRKDKPARRMAWQNFVDMLCKEGKVTTNQFNTWHDPKCCE